MLSQKNKLRIAFTFLFSALLISVSFASDDISIFVDNVKLNTPVKIENNRTLLPIRAFYEQDNYTVHWNQKDKTVYVQKGSIVIKLPLNKNVAYVNNVKTALDVKTKSYDNKTYIPVRFVNETMGYTVNWKKDKKKVVIKTDSKDFDVIVVGTDPEGITAAIAAAREGQRTLLVDKRSKIGGLYTIAKLNSIDMNMLNGKLITHGAFEEFYNGINKKTAFDINEAQNVFNKMVSDEDNITLVLNAKTITPIVKGNSIKSISVQLPYKSVEYSGKQFIDSTQNADIAYQVGESFTFGQEDYRQSKETMNVTLVFELKGVDYKRVFNYLNYEDNNAGTGADKSQAWGYWEMFNYPSAQHDVSMRGLNIGLQKNGNVLINALLIEGIDGTDPSQLALAKQKAKQELPGIVSYMKSNLVGFKNVSLAGYADELYVRETRHLKGQYRLTVDDLLENRDFPDKIAFGNYPLDVQSSATQKGFIVGNPEHYSIPFRSIVPKNINNLLVASRSASYDSLAHGSSRVVPIGMNVGQAAGIASAYANKNNVNFITMATQSDFNHVKNIQKILNRNGAQLTKIPSYNIPIMKHQAYDAVKFFRKYALISGNYDNVYKLEVLPTTAEFNRFILLANQRSLINKNFIYPFESNNEIIQKTHIEHFLSANGLTLDTPTMHKINSMNKDAKLTRDIVLMFLYDVLRQN